MATPKQTDPQFKLRLPFALKEKIEAAASQNNRSINAEMVDRLETSFEGPVVLPRGLARRVEVYAASQGRTLSDEVILTLARRFPEARSPDKRFAEILAILSGLRHRDQTDTVFDKFTVEVLRQLRSISDGEIQVDPETKERVSSALENWEEDLYNAGMAHATFGMSEQEIENYVRTGDDRVIIDPVFKEDEK